MPAVSKLLRTSGNRIMLPVLILQLRLDMKAISLAASAALVLLGVAACGSSGPAYYLAIGSGAVLLVQWQAPQGGQAAGSITEDQTDGTAPDETLEVNTVPVKVVIDGDQVSFTVTGFDALFSGGSIDGTLNNGDLTITTPPDSGNGAIQTSTLGSSGPSSYN